MVLFPIRRQLLGNGLNMQLGRNPITLTMQA